MAAPKPAQLAIVLSPVCTVIIPAEDTQKMGNLSIVVQRLKKEQARAQKEVQRIGAALAALGSISSNGASRQRTISTSTRRKISLAQKARWAKQKAATP